jgi:16S rRNA (adenine1518-N6/adenine1519-N6)-dimethyltransferase
LVAQAFSQRRKTLRNTLKDLVKREDFAQLNIDPGQRAEELPVSAFVELADLTCNTLSTPDI